MVAAGNCAVCVMVVLVFVRWSIAVVKAVPSLETPIV
jgi:hypothetical protein